MTDETQTPVQENPAENPATEAPATPAAPETAAEEKGRQMSFTVLEDRTVRAEFGPGLEPLVFNPAALPDALMADAIVEGILQRLRGYTSKLTGENRTPEKLREAVAKGLENIFAKGLWKIEREPGDPGASISVEAEAAFVFRQKRAVAKGLDIATAGDLVTAAKQFAELDEAKKKQLKETPLYKVAYAEVKARRAQENVAKLAKAAEAMADDSGLF